MIDEKNEKMENDDFILYADGTLIPKKKKTGILNVFSLVLMILLFAGFYHSWLQFFKELSSLNSDYYELNKNAFFAFISAFNVAVEIFVIRTIFTRSNSRSRKISYFIGAHVFLFSFIFLFSFLFLIASMPAATPVSLCYAWRPWWGFFNFLTALVPALFIGSIFYFAAKNSFPES